jgi:hypothetical protein
MSSKGIVWSRRSFKEEKKKRDEKKGGREIKVQKKGTKVRMYLCYTRE